MFIKSFILISLILLISFSSVLLEASSKPFYGLTAQYARWYGTEEGDSIAVYGGMVIINGKEVGTYNSEVINVFYGDSGNDYIIGGAGIDYIYGGTGKDSLYGGDGDDLLDTGDAWPLFLIEEPSGNPCNKCDKDYIDGGNGKDKLFLDSCYDTFLFDENDEITR